MKTSKRVSVVTNFALILILAAVFSVSFFIEPLAPIYGGKALGAIYGGNKSGVKVSLMFNVYENAEIVNAIIDELDKSGAKATFFVGGCWADDNAQTLKRIAESGNEIANHGYFHKDHKKLSLVENKKEIAAADAVITALSGVKPKLFAPPSGSFSSAVLESAEELGYKVIMWSKDTIDWRDKDEKKIISRATKDLAGGDFILMHPKPHTLKVLPEIIKICKNKGFSLVTVSENLKENITDGAA